jgi:hypothetical protein
MSHDIGAGNEARTRDLNLGKVALYQLSYSRDLSRGAIVGPYRRESSRGPYSSALPRSSGHAMRRYRIIDQSVSTAAMAVRTRPSL